MPAACFSSHERTRSLGDFRVRSERTSVSTSQAILWAVVLAAARWQIERGGALHVNVEPIARRLHLAQDDFMGRGIVFNNEMITFPQFATLADFLRDNDLAPAGHGCSH